MRAEPGAGPPAASAAAASAHANRSHLRLLALGLGGIALLLTTVLLGYALIAARVPQHRAALEELVRHETGLDISFSRLSVHWGWYGPQAVFQDISVGELPPGPALRAPQLIVSLDAWRMARSGRFEAGRITFVNPDIDLSAPRTGAAPPAAPGATRASALESAARLLARWRGDRLDLEGGTIRLPSGTAAPPLIVSLRHAQLRRRAADWSLDAQALLPDSLGDDLQLTARVHGDMAQPHSLYGSVRLLGERLVFGGWHGVLGEQALAAYLPGAGSGNLELNAQLARGAVTSIAAALRAESLEWLPRATGAAALRLPRLRADWQLVQRPGGWVFSARNVDAGAGSAVSSQVWLADEGTAQGVVRAIPLGLAADIARWHDPRLPLAQLALGGTVRELDFAWDARRPAGARLRTFSEVAGLEVADDTHELALRGLSARVSGNDTQLLVDLSADAAQIASSRAQPVQIDGLNVGARLLVGTDGARWHVRTSNLEIRREGMLVLLRGMVGAGTAADAGRVDAHIDLKEADAVMLASLLGARTGSAFGIDAGRISAGRIANGTLELRGPLYVDSDEVRPPGEFRGSLELRDLSIAGDESWPAVQELAAHLDWRGDLVKAAISHARSGSFQLSSARLEWDPRAQRGAHFSGRLAGQAQEALQWLRDRPDVGRYAPGLAGIDLRGETLLDVDVKLPAQRAAPPRVRVTAVLDGTRLQALAGVPAVQVQHGALGFADGHLQHTSLTGQWLGGPVTLGIGEHREHGTTSIAIAARGLMDVHQGLLAAGDADPDAGFTGSTEWTAQVNIPAQASAARWILRADTSLVGVTSHLPEPLTKAAEASLPLHVEMQGGDSDAQLRVALGERLRALVALERRADAWRIERGALRLAASAPALPADPVFMVDGRISRLDTPRYLALWRATAGDAALPPLKGDVTASELLLGGRSYPEVRVLAHATRRGGELELQSAQLSAAVRWPDDAQQPARLELARFDAADAAELLQARRAGSCDAAVRRGPALAGAPARALQCARQPRCGGRVVHRCAPDRRQRGQPRQRRVPRQRLHAELQPGQRRCRSDARRLRAAPGCRGAAGKPCRAAALAGGRGVTPCIAAR